MTIHGFYESGLLLLACLGLTQVTGCTWMHSESILDLNGRTCRQSYADIDVSCHGYHSTCWRTWPEECGTCPPPTWLPGGAGISDEPSPEMLPEVPIPPPTKDIPPPTTEESPELPAPPNSPASPPSHSSSQGFFPTPVYIESDSETP